MLKKISTFLEKVGVLSKGGGEDKIRKRKEKGLLTARERIDTLLDKGTFNEIDLFVQHQGRDFGLDRQTLPADGVITGFGKVHGRDVCVYAQDFTVQGGSLGRMHAAKITKVMDLASEMGVPVIGINDSGGARIQEGVDSLAGYGEIFYRNTICSGKIPQISVIMGPCAGGAVYSPAITDFVFMVDKKSKMFITGPKVIESVLNQKIGAEELGGAMVHNKKTGNAHFFAKDELETFKQIRRLLQFIPSAWDKKAPVFDPKPPKSSFKIADIVPEDSRKAYDIKDLIKSIVDDSDFMEVQEYFAQNLVVGFARIEGKTVGVVANQPKILAGVLDSDSSDKGARFVRFCDAYSIPILTFVDLPGYLPGIDQEHNGVIRHGAKLLYAFSEASVPRVTLIVRKAYGGGYIAMSSKHLRTDFVFAWPTAEVAVMGPEGACNIIFAKEIMESKDPEKTRAEKVAEYKEKFSNPYNPASKGYIDAVIHPDDTRYRIANALNIAKDKKPYIKKHKHGCIPL
ncbi:MAG: methylmalonyl-CoA carboxyltransferase [Candidatus Cloacimonadota bacterium]|nr:MAG: methylmalonyl-CoA carboxyltransferase [Candidatus Cloacimonadota bacterium]PIE77761.1 MAG: methylmalonyl-CoA carboxyltransferase [Candidatus Delongbacteria bacterium]